MSRIAKSGDPGLGTRWVGLVLGLWCWACASGPALAEDPDDPGLTYFHAPVTEVDLCASEDRPDPPQYPPPGAVDDELINRIYEDRPWESPELRIADPLQFGIDANIPVHRARAKLIGIRPEDAYLALAARLWLIEQAEHTIDIAYYIFKRDLVGYAMIGSLCDAVKRGVDVRVVIDSLGSIHPTHSELKALETCAENAGYIRNAEGRPTTRRARVQVVIFNPISAVFQKLANSLRNVQREQQAAAGGEPPPIRNWTNRRMHDKLLVVDGFFPEKAAVITGGRNISLSYYGFDKQGRPDPNSYLDMDILLRMEPDDLGSNPHLGSIAETYFHLLFSHLGNKRLEPNQLAAALGVYRRQLDKARKSLAKIRSLEPMQRQAAKMPDYMGEDFYRAEVRLGHELVNLLNRNVVTNLAENRFRNPNSIMHLIQRLGEEAGRGDVTRIVSPYLFLTRYKDPDGRLVVDEYEDIQAWLKEDPKRRLEIVTNSVLTSDNLLAQSIIDMDIGPRLLLSKEYRKAWGSGPSGREKDSELVESPEWQRMVSHPQIYLYQTGRLDSARLRENGVHYGKLHAKFFSDDTVGFVGTSNFDYRSRLLNSEMGYFFLGEGILDDMHRDFERLKRSSYRWGSPEWLEMRDQYRRKGGVPGVLSGWQRPIYKLLRGLSL